MRPEKMMSTVLINKKIYWVLLVLCGLFFLSAQHVNAQSAPRLLIKLSKYEGDPKLAYDQFYMILK
ncbi:MAG: hypothetical protein DRH26_07300, partial [Deltaproteobacteria bacterium]